MSRSWIAQGERGSPMALWVIRWIALHLGRRVGRVLLYPITVYFLLRAKCSRRFSREYLTRVLPHPVRCWHVARHFHSFAAVILDRVYLLCGRYDALNVTLHDETVFIEQIKSGKGCILLGSHLGSFEVLRALGTVNSAVPIKVLMYPEQNQTITRLLEALNPQISRSVIPLGGVSSLIKAKECLDQGELIGMLGDRVAHSDKVVECDFLGAKALFPQGPMLLASALKVPVLLCFGLYRGANHYDIYFEPFTSVAHTRGAQREAQLRQGVQAYADRLAFHTRQAPYNWFNFYDYWNRDTTK